nr:wsc domain-containing protein [Quercus suber]
MTGSSLLVLVSDGQGLYYSTLDTDLRSVLPNPAKSTLPVSIGFFVDSMIEVVLSSVNTRLALYIPVKMHFTSALVALSATLASAQQFMGNAVNNSLPYVPGAEVTYWKIKDTSRRNINMTVPTNIKRAVIFIHGLNRDPGTYESNMLSALSQVKTDKNINSDTVSIVAPYFPNGDDKDSGYPFTDGLPAGQGSTSDCLVWKTSQWSAGGNNQYPYRSKITSSYTVLDQMIQYYDNKTMFPNMNQIVIAGHSLGAQMVQRYAAIANVLNTQTPSEYSNETIVTFAYSPGSYPMTYGLDLVNSGRAAILANWNSRQTMFARGMNDMGDDSMGCAPSTTGMNRNERMYTYLQAFPASCPDPAGNNCDTVDLVPGVGHDAGGMMASSAGLQRLFIDNFYGNGTRAYDFGYPRQLPNGQDDPYPNPALDGTPPAGTNTNIYAGNMTSYGCWSDQANPTLSNMTYSSNANTIELCTSTCAQGGNTIAGLESSRCYCGTALGFDAVQVIPGSCTTSCPGASSETCGGNSRISIFSNGQPTLKSQPRTPQTVGSFTSLGCYTEASSGRALSGAATSGSFVDLEYCANFCGKYEYFGTEYADECYCGNTLGSGSNTTSAGDCSMVCAGDDTEFCGAGNRLTLYQNTGANVTTAVSSSTQSASSSTSVTGSVTSTSAPATATTSALSCPGSNSTVYTSGSGNQYLIECSIDHVGGDIASTSVNSLAQCIAACDQQAGCIDVSLSGVGCYMKGTLGAAVAAANVYGAKLLTGTSSSSSSSSVSSVSTSSVSTSTASTSTVSQTSTTTSASATASVVSCPGSNSTTYVSNGLSFLIECGIDHIGGDMSSLTVGSLSQCIDTCANTPGCVDVSLSGTACYLKSSVGGPRYNGVNGGKLITNSSSASSSVSSSATTSASSTSSSATVSASSTSSASSISSSTTFVTSSSTSSTSSSSASASATALACPASNNTIYTAPTNNQSFLIECGIDHPGGDMGVVQVSNFTQCVNACDTTTGCVDVSLSGVACYLKSSLVAAKSAPAILGAKLVASSSTTSTTSASASSSSTSSSVVTSSTST